MTDSIECFDDNEDPELRLCLESIRPYLAPGAVFWVPERNVGRYMKKGERPIMLVGPVPSLNGIASAVLSRTIRVAPRRSWKPEIFPLPKTEEDEYAVLERYGYVFTRKRLLRGFSKHGFFELNFREPLALRALHPDAFEDFLPRPYVEIILAKMGAPPLRGPYPPQVP